MGRHMPSTSWRESRAPHYKGLSKGALSIQCPPRCLSFRRPAYLPVLMALSAFYSPSVSRHDV